ncbi:MAG: hypothetical protein RR285_00195 [Acinetobacter sp.]
MRIIAIEIQNLAATGMMLGSVIPKGSLGITVDDYKFDVYKWVTAKDIDFNSEVFAKMDEFDLKILKSSGQKALFAMAGNELLHVFGYTEGSSNGFANREIVLRIEEPSVMFPKIKAVRQRTFRGCLWDSHYADKMVAAYLGTQIFNLGIKRGRDRGNTYTSIKATYAMAERLSKAVVFGTPIQADFNEGLE